MTKEEFLEGMADHIALADMLATEKEMEKMAVEVEGFDPVLARHIRNVGTAMGAMGGYIKATYRRAVSKCP